MSTFSRFTKLVSALPATVPFVGPETQERQTGDLFKARLGANENGFGFSPLVEKAIAEKAHLSWRYGDPENHDLRAELSKHYRISSDHIAIGEGIDGLLGLIVRMLVEPGVNVVTSFGAYPTFNYHVNGFGGTLHKVPYKNDYEDLDGLLDEVRETNAALVYLSNPDNPMGTIWSAAKINDFIDNLPDDTMLILDEAYCETAPAHQISPITQYLSKPNVLRTRTFSKAYGLAGIRVGYVIGHPDSILMFDRIRDHFGMSRISQIAALAALKDQDFLSESVSNIAKSRERISKFVASLGFEPIASATNFVTFDCGKDGDYARKLLAFLIERGVFVRMPAVAPLDRCIRVSAAPDEELKFFERAFTDAISAVS